MKDWSHGTAARGLSDHYREIFEITPIADFITILHDEGAPRVDEPAALAAVT